MTAEFYIFGPPKLIRKGKRVRLHSLKATGLLAYLVCQPETVHSRDTLATLLWGGFPEAKARQSLRQALYSLRRALAEVAETCLIVDGHTVTFIPSKEFSVDLLEFDHLVEAGNLQAAVELFRGTLLEGIAFDDCPAFEEWLFWARDRTTQRINIVLQEIVDGYLAAGQVAKAIQYGLRLVALDWLNEGAYRRLMRAYAAQGDLDAVRKHYHQCRDKLNSELGVEPAAETVALYQTLLTATDPLASRPPTSPVPKVSFPFVGCKRELDQLSSLFAQSVAGQISLVFVEGEAGSGKSELIFEFWRRTSKDQPLSLLVGRAYEAEMSAPYTMWAEALSVINTENWQTRMDGLSPAWRQQLARLVPGKIPPPPEISTSAAENQLRFMQGIVQSLIHLTRDEPLLLLFDDLQWSDTASLELLHYASRQCLSYPILIVGAYRREALENRTSLQSLINKRQHLTIELSALREKDIQSILAQAEFPHSETVVSHLYDHCHGNRLMLIETLRLLQESDGLNRLSTDDRLPIPPRIQDLVAARLAKLSEQQRRVLASAAIIGRPFDLTLLHHVTGQPEVALLEDVNTLTVSGFLEEEERIDREQISFQHAFARRAIYADMRQSQRRALHRRAADALLTSHQTRPELVVEEVAFHFEQAGDARALTYLVQAAELAESRFALPQATQWLSRALAFQERYLPDDLEGRFNILLAHERLLAQQGQRAAQAEDIAALISLAEKLAISQRLADALIRQAGYLSDVHQEQESVQVAERALALYRVAQDRQGEAQALRELGFHFWSSEEYGLALAYGRKVLRLHRQLGDLHGEATALHNLAEIYRGLDSPRQAISLYEQALRLHWARQDHERQTMSFYGMAHALRQLGRLQQTQEKYRQTLAQSKLAGDRLMASRVHHEMGVLKAELGDPEAAIVALEQAAAISREIGYAPGLAHTLVSLGLLYVRLQQTEDARSALLEAADNFRLMEDTANLRAVTDSLRKMDKRPGDIETSLAQTGWVRTYVTLVEGKVYCEYESPLVATFNSWGKVGPDGLEPPS